MKRIIISDEEKNKIRQMHESYRETGNVISEEIARNINIEGDDVKNWIKSNAITYWKTSENIKFPLHGPYKGTPIDRYKDVKISGINNKGLEVQYPQKNGELRLSNMNPGGNLIISVYTAG